LHPVTSQLNFGLTRGPVSIGWRSNLSLVSDKLTLPNTNGQRKCCQAGPARSWKPRPDG
jgi:hypothetical protein